VDKPQLRLYIRELLKKPSDSSFAIINRLQNLAEFVLAKKVFCYVSCDGEVDTLELISSMISSGKEICVPVCKDNNIIMCGIGGLDDMDTINKYGIKEPSKHFEIDCVDIAIIPGLAYDGKGNRLGRGGGFYDKWFAECIRIAPAWEFQIVDFIPIDKWDKKVDIIVTEKRIIRRINE
jgi:5-formyltetrahydrofolate cyclo-ligase